MSKTKQQELEVGEGMTFFLIRQKFWQSLEQSCRESYKRTNDPFYVFWKAFAAFKLGNTNDAINDLTTIQQKKEISYAVYAALIFYHNQTRNIDKEELQTLRGKEREERRNGADKAFIQAIYFYINVGQWRRATELLNQKNSKSVAFRLAKCWLDFLNPKTQGFQEVEKEAEELFQEKDRVVPKIQLFNLRANIAIALRKYEVALETVNQGIVFYPDFIPLLNEKCNCLMSLTQWEQFNEVSQEIISKDPSNILATKCIAFNELARQGNIDNAYMRLRQLENIIDRKEGKNASLLFQIAQLFSRICGRNVKIINLLQKFIGKCRKLDPLNADYAIQMSYEYLMLGETAKAYAGFQQAASLDESKIQAITGMIECKIADGEIDDAQHQIQFVNVLQMNGGKTSQTAYLQALLEMKKPSDGPESFMSALKFVDNALKMQIAFTKTLSQGFSMYSKLNPDFLYSLAELYLNHVSMNDMLKGAENASPTQPVGKGLKLLDTITRPVPGFLPAYMLIAKGKLAVGNDIDAAAAVSKVLDIDPRNEEGYILQAMIKRKRKQYESALVSLQEAISHNFKIRQNPLFMLIKGEIEYEKGDYVSAEMSMQQAISLPSIKNKQAVGDNKKYKVISFSEKDRCSIYLLLAKCLAKNKKPKQSKAIMDQAINEFMDTTEGVNVTLTNALISVENGDIKKAISILKAVKQNSPYFVESRKLLADINLKHLKSRKNYARCYYEVIEAEPSFENYKLYGDALISINEPEDAAIAYQKAYELKSDNEAIIRDLGHAYSMSHEYDKAINFYESNLSKFERLDLIIDLAKLYIQLKRFEKAQSLLNPEKFSDEQATLSKLKQNVEGFYTLYRLFLKKQGSLDYSPNDNARKSIKKCIAFQQRVLEKARSEGGNVTEQKKLLADYFYQVANYTNNYEKTPQASIKMLTECLKQWPQHQKALELISTIFLKTGEIEKCQYNCELLLKINPKNDQASFILTEIMLNSNQYEKAIEQFKKILSDKPGNYPVLAKLIVFFRRNNELDKAKQYLAVAQSKASNTNDAGLCFCRGLYNKYMRSARDALAQFNKAKKSAQYAEQSLVHMIDIYLNPDQDLYYSCIEEKIRMVDSQNIRVCQSLLRQMQTRASFHRYVTMEAYVVMMSSKPYNNEELTKKLADVLKVRQDYVPAMFAFSILKFLAKKETQAKNVLKILAKANYDSENGQELEKAWLLHAQSFIKIQKYDNAEETLRALLKANKSCGKAQQFMGIIKQKQQAYVDAANHYEKAFNLTMRKSAPIAYRLAFNYLKAKRYIECIQICRGILEAYPNYPNIEREVLDKAIQALK